MALQSKDSSLSGKSSMLVRSRMTADVITVSPSTTIAQALTLTRKHRIRHLPVIDEGKLAGVVTDRDLRLAMPPIWADENDELRRALNEKTVGEVMVKDVKTTSADTPIENAARVIYEHRIGCLPVMDGDELIGILTETDVLRSFVELFGHDDTTSRLEIRLPNRPGELARVVRLIGIDHKLNITGMVVPPLSGNEALAIVHVATLDPRSLIEALRKLGYRVGSPSLDIDDEEPEREDPAEARRRYWAEAL
jgi:acetoin utilization protein AcuB